MSDNKNDDNMDDVVTMVDVLNEEEEKEKEYYAVLGAGDSKCCTYPKGYIKRQALYSCLTCIPESRNDPSKRAGVCLACYYNCHEGHEVVELYTKRNFRCDCGNSKFLNATQKSCNLEPCERDPVNQYNDYNQNFSGLYCTCHRPYPDAEDPIDDTMIQCCLCEDWFHERHLGTAVPSAYDEMICNDCMKSYEFLKLYIDLMIRKDSDKTKSETGDNSTVDIETVPAPEEPADKKRKLDNMVCHKPTNVQLTYANGATFWKEAWRNMLCHCSQCMDMYKALKIEYIVDQEDPVKVYEEKGTNRLATDRTLYERGMSALTSLDRTKQVHLLSGFKSMQEKLSEYLSEFARDQRVVTKADIEQFFNQIKNEPASVPPQNFCR